MIRKLIDNLRGSSSPLAEQTCEPSMVRLVSQACTQSQLEDPIFAHWCREIGEHPRLHRKQWEFAFIMQALNMHDLLRPGRSGLGFGVGTEPLAAAMAARGVTVLGTDLEPERAVEIGWTDTNQHAANRIGLNSRGLCDPEQFDRLVDFRFMDMTAIDPDLTGKFDFCWSACAFEHLGTIEKGLEFVERSIDCLKPGGIAVHTTELNCSSDIRTVKQGGTVLFRQRDFRQLRERLLSKGYGLTLNFNIGTRRLDKYVDVAPFRPDEHLKLQIEKFTTTSFGVLAVPLPVNRDEA